MNYCNNCNINVSSYLFHCPICNNICNKIYRKCIICKIPLSTGNSNGNYCKECKLKYSRTTKKYYNTIYGDKTNKENINTIILS